MRDDEWITNQYGGRENVEALHFIPQLNNVVHSQVQGAMILAGDSSAWPPATRSTDVGGLGFTFQWDLHWVQNIVEYLRLDLIHRRYQDDNVTPFLRNAYPENFVLSLSHDEVACPKDSLLKKMPGDLWQSFANLRTFYGYVWGYPGKKLLFMGGEFGQCDEWNHTKSLDWHLLEPPGDPFHIQLRTFVRDLNRLYQREPALSELDYWPDGFFWLDTHDADNSIVAFIRCSKRMEDTLVFVCNFTPIARFGSGLAAPRTFT